jgi:two-component system, response regulator PdtaR
VVQTPPDTPTYMTSNELPRPLRVLVIEDEFVIADFLAALLTAQGFVVAAQVGTVEAALAAIETVAFDCALLDVNLNGVSIAPVADRLAARGQRYVFLTGYARHRLPAGHAHAPCVGKPVKTPELVAALSGGTGTDATGTDATGSGVQPIGGQT